MIKKCKAICCKVWDKIKAASDFPIGLSSAVRKK